MDYYILDLPESAKVLGILPATFDDFTLQEDIIQIQLENGYGLDLGYYQEFPLLLTIYRNRDFNDQVDVVEIWTPEEAKNIIENLAKKYSEIK
jgi:hypothetical protein